MPWQIELMLFGLGMLASGVTVLIGTVVLNHLTETAVLALSATWGSQAPIPIPTIGHAWPLLLFGFAVLSVRLYLTFRRLLARKLEVGLR